MAPSQLDAVYRQYFPLIRAKCARMLGDAGDAEDVAQETFVRLWRGGPLSDDPRQITAWIYRTSTRAAIDRMRQRRRQGTLHAEAEAERGPSRPEAALAARRTLFGLLHVVPQEELLVGLLSRCDRLGQEQIAEVAEVSERTVRRLLQRFEARLGQLGDKDTDP